MANDILVSKSGQAIKNGTAVVSCTRTGEFSNIDTYVLNTPAIADIQSKYDARFDEIRYYTCCSGTP